MAKETKEQIIKTAALLVHRQGFNNTGLGEILKTAGVPKGSFYHYFKSKDDLGLALVDYYGKVMAGEVSPFLHDQDLPPLERLKKMYEKLKQDLEVRGFAMGCPLGNLTQEMADLHPEFRARLSRVLASFEAEIATLLEEARQKGQLPENLSPKNTAAFILQSWQGSLLAMKLSKSQAPLSNFMQAIFGHLLNSQ
ncbi:TetR/AcrR family transcriptional regulator [Dethiosulfatarculus sandiegensis]|uniref:TetR family transcriptional regulator n=1 Tax=Dethiosulfatarculus sandiegensis TaxID=1429043 RepID=A0A0D2K080_9BACT|nr:TetR/AcrR family transcriptional regulator [Dethiosulfatarculus sandiegensis]KIX15145.1 TetR family transcriptional regulator [Dethiosulfatarculus sandiegensis]